MPRSPEGEHFSAGLDFWCYYLFLYYFFGVCFLLVFRSLVCRLFLSFLSSLSFFCSGLFYLFWLFFSVFCSLVFLSFYRLCVLSWFPLCSVFLFWLWFLLLLVGFSSFAVVSVLVKVISFAGCFPPSEGEWIKSNTAIVRKSGIVFSRIAVYFNLFVFCEVFKKIYLI